jgi:hypothetical protein
MPGSVGRVPLRCEVKSHSISLVKEADRNVQAGETVDLVRHDAQNLHHAPAEVDAAADDTESEHPNRPNVGEAAGTMFGNPALEMPSRVSDPAIATADATAKGLPVARHGVVPIDTNTREQNSAFAVSAMQSWQP